MLQDVGRVHTVFVMAFADHGFVDVGDMDDLCENTDLIAGDLIRVTGAVFVLMVGQDGLQDLDVDQIRYIANNILNQVLYGSDRLYDMMNVCAYDDMTYMHSVNVTVLSIIWLRRRRRHG